MFLQRPVSLQYNQFSLPQTEHLREYEHLRYIPIVILAPTLPHMNGKLNPLYLSALLFTVFPQLNGVSIMGSAPI